MRKIEISLVAGLIVTGALCAILGIWLGTHVWGVDPPQCGPYTGLVMNKTDMGCDSKQERALFFRHDPAARDYILPWKQPQQVVQQQTQRRAQPAPQQ